MRLSEGEGQESIMSGNPFGNPFRNPQNDAKLKKMQQIKKRNG